MGRSSLLTISKVLDACGEVVIANCYLGIKFRWGGRHCLLLASSYIQVGRLSFLTISQVLDSCGEVVIANCYLCIRFSWGGCHC